MKGPGLRTRYDVHRLWRCPETGKTLKAGGDVTQMRSPFTRQERFMEFVEVVKAPRYQMPLDEILEHMQIAPEPPAAETVVVSESETSAPSLAADSSPVAGDSTDPSTAELTQSETPADEGADLPPAATAEPLVDATADTVVDSETALEQRSSRRSKSRRRPRPGSSNGESSP